MTAQSFGASYRSTSDRILRKTLAIGLGGSTLLHTAAIAGTSYFYQENIEDLQITEIERVEVKPVPTPSTKPVASVAKPIPTPSTKPIAPVAKPILAPEPKVTKPIVDAFPAPKPVAIPTPKSVATSAPVVKITKAAVPVKLPTAPVVKAALPQPKQVAKTVTPAKDVTNKTARSQPTTKTQNQSKITNNKPAFGNTSLPSSPLRPSSSTENIDDNPTGDGSTPGQPGNGEKLARSNAPAPSGNNQTSLASSNKSPQGLGKQADATESNDPSDREDFGIGSGSGGLPGNNARIANSRSTIAGGGTSSNQIGLGGIRTNSPNIGDGLRTSGGSADGFSSSGGSGDGLGGNGDDFISGAPGNNGRIARGSGIGNGGNGTGGKGNGNGNQAGLGGGGGTGNGGGRRYGSQFGSLDGTGNSNTYSNTSGNDELGNGPPGNIATGSRNELKIQCLRNCDIKYPENLEDAEIGRDKMLVKVTIDANGKVTNAQIARSSGNPNLDRVALDGVKQMQLTAMGKQLTFRAKISTLANN